MDTNNFAGQEWTRIKEALHNLAEDSGASAEYAKGVLIGIVSALMSFGMSFRDAFRECYTRFPVNFRIKAVPSEWIGYEDDWSHVDLTHITSFSNLVMDLPDKISDEVMDDLMDKYLYVVGMMANMSKDAKKPMMVLSPFRNSGSQWICEWALKDLNKPNDISQMNWHGQFTSQWVYAGAICVQDGRVSIHT